jgi:alkylation response protein AidB-like acyl-CoA dehydrogenase
MSSTTAPAHPPETLRTLPGDDVRQLMWRFSDRYDLQMLVQSVRSVARGPVARLVAEGARHSHEWTEQKNQLLEAYDSSGLTAAYMEPDQGGFIAGPKNMALSLAAFELAWVDAGSATGALAGFLALSPIQERGTKEQRDHYMSLAAPAQPGEDRKPWRGSFVLTEPIPYVGVDTGMLNGKVRVAEWKDGEEPLLHVEKRGRFITNMGFANFVTVAVDTADERIKSSCMVILEETDPGIWDRGTPTKKLVHQLSSTSDPIFSMTVPASRIIGGYRIEDGKIVPNFDHSQVIEKVFAHTRVTVGMMTAAKLLSAVEPVIRYQRGRFRGADQAKPGSIRYELGLQQREDALHRLVEVWATGEAAASIGFEASRIFDEWDVLAAQKDELLAAQGIHGARAELKYFKAVNQRAVELLELEGKPEAERDAARYEALKADPMVRFALVDAIGNVLCPATKLWNTGHGATMLREAVSLMGGYGITEDCPGFLGHKWMDSQLEATYEGPEAVQRRQLSVTMTSEVFLAQFRRWMDELTAIGHEKPATGACALAKAMGLWLWTLEHLQGAKDSNGQRLFTSPRQGVSFPMADALSWLLASRSHIMDVVELEKRGPESPTVAEGLAGLVSFMQDLAFVQVARAAGEAARICSELVHGYLAHPAWDAEKRAACAAAKDVAAIQGFRRELAGCEAAGCAACGHVDEFGALRLQVDGCLAGCQLAKDRAAAALTQVMIPEALDYPA